jgi:hypothetical protein
MEMGGIIFDSTMLALLLVGITLILTQSEFLRDQREERRKHAARSSVIHEKEQWRELNEKWSKQLEEAIAEQRATAKEIEDGKSNLGGGPFGDLDLFFRKSAELLGIDLRGLNDDSLRMIARYVSEYREDCLYPLLERETGLNEASFELEFAQVLDGPGSVASLKASIRSSTERMPHLRKKMHTGLRQLRFNVREVSARHRGVPKEQALKDADDARAREPEVYSFMEDLIYRGRYVVVPRNDLFH